jgi:hypothetical protein
MFAYVEISYFDLIQSQVKENARIYQKIVKRKQNKDGVARINLMQPWEENVSLLVTCATKVSREFWVIC